MTRSAQTAATAYPPVMLDEPAAAAYVSISVSKIRELREIGDFPKRVKIGSRRLYRRSDLDAWALSLPAEGEEDGDGAEGTCHADEVFG
ncbi:MAG: helix-turn-helix domain-containing protein [Devosia sp.]